MMRGKMAGTRPPMSHMTRRGAGGTMTTRLHVEDDVLLLDAHGNGLRGERALRQRFAGHDLHLIGACLDAFGMAPGLAGLDIELPAVPGAAQHFSMPGQAIFARAVGGEAAEDGPKTQRRPFMGAAIHQRVEFTMHVEYADLAAGYCDDLARAGSDLIGGGDDVARHQALVPRAGQQENGTADERK